MRQRPRQGERLEQPVVERAVDLELERADRVRDALDVIAQPVRVVVHRVDAPAVAGVVVRGVADAVEHRVAQPHVGSAHVDAGPQRARTVGELAGAHALEQVEALLDRAVAPAALLPLLGRRSAHRIDLGGGVVAHEGAPAADQLERELVERLEVVGGEERLQRRRAGVGGQHRAEVDVARAVHALLVRGVAGALHPQAVVGPARDQPAQVLGDRLHVLDVLAGRVGVVHPQVAVAAELPRDPEVEADRLGVADVEVAVGLGREAGHHLAHPAGGEILLHDLADEVEAFAGRLLRGRHRLPRRSRPLSRGHRGSHTRPRPDRGARPRS